MVPNKNGSIEDLPQSIRTPFNEVLIAVRAVVDVRAVAATEAARKQAVEKKKLEMIEATTKQLQQEKMATAAAAIAMAFVSRHSTVVPQTAAELEEEEKEIEALAMKAADEIDSDEDDSIDQVPYSIDDIGKPPVKKAARRKPKGGGALTGPKGHVF